MNQSSAPHDDANSLFQNRTVWILGGLTLISLVVVASLTIFNFGQKPTAGADGYSDSALGHSRLIAALKRLGVPVVQSQSNSVAKAQKGLLIYAEPIVSTQEESDKFAKGLQAAEQVLIVLPKWIGRPDPKKPEWIAAIDAIPVDEYQYLFKGLDLEGSTIRRGNLDAPFVSASGATASAEIPVQPQLMLLANDIETATSGNAPVLVYHAGSSTIIADPDVLNNHGIGRGNNLKLVIDLINELRGEGPVIFDETTHGFTHEPSLWKTLFEFPIVLATIQVLLTVMLIAISMVGRFGPAPKEGQAMTPGKDFLITNTAALLGVAGHDADALRRYWASTQQHVKRELRVPRELLPSAQHQWLDRVAASRGVATSVATLAGRVEQIASSSDQAAKITDCAQQIFAWRVGMTRTASSGERPQKGD
jgi:hypothetical protein